MTRRSSILPLALGAALLLAVFAVDILLPAGSPGAGLIPYELRWHPAPARYRIP